MTNHVMKNDINIPETIIPLTIQISLSVLLKAIKSGNFCAKNISKQINRIEA